MWYNTTKEANKTALDARAKSQEEFIWMWFTLNSCIEATPFEVHRKCGLNSPITSIRRAITNLTKEGKLVKTDRKVIEKYGVSNYTWTVNPQQRQLDQLSLF